jgi:hypothetical protein
MMPNDRWTEKLDELMEANREKIIQQVNEAKAKALLPSTENVLNETLAGWGGLIGVVCGFAWGFYEHGIGGGLVFGFLFGFLGSWLGHKFINIVALVLMFALIATVIWLIGLLWGVGALK